MWIKFCKKRPRFYLFLSNKSFSTRTTSRATNIDAKNLLLVLFAGYNPYTKFKKRNKIIFIIFFSLRNCKKSNKTIFPFKVILFHYSRLKKYCTWLLITEKLNTFIAFIIRLSITRHKRWWKDFCIFKTIKL